MLVVANQAVIALKVVGLVLVLLLRPNLRLGLFKGRLPLFYALICGLAVVNLLVHVQDFSKNYLISFCLAMMYWLVCLFCCHQLKLSIEKKGLRVVHRSLQLFTVINLVASVYQLVHISILTGKLNPYVSLPFPYGMSTGDNIYGAFLQLSYCNMMVSAMLCMYFLFRGDFWYGLAACTSLLLVFGNVGNIIFTTIIILLLLISLAARLLPKNSVLASTMSRLTPPRSSWKIYVGFTTLFLVFYGLISFENLRYTGIKLAEKVEQASTPKTRARAKEEAIEADRFKALRFDQYECKPYVPDRVDFARRTALTKLACSELAGKRLSLRETKAYLLINAQTLLLGAGPNRFSSLTAARMSGLDSSRIFSKMLPRFYTPAYHDNHRLLNVVRVGATQAEYSNSNWPDTFYNQLLGEYGLLGAILFAVFYAWFFLRRFRQLSYGIWISAMLIPFALLTYLFEPLCVMLFFELLMFIDIARHSNQKEADSYA